MSRIEVIDDGLRSGLILGLPNTGTTIINSFFNSFENCFSLSEPFWSFDSKKGGDTTFLDKIGGQKEFSDSQEIAEYIRSALDRDEYDLGFVKETFSGTQEKLDSLGSAFSVGFDLLLFVFRDPAVTFDGREKIVRVRRGPASVVRQFNDLWDLYQEQKERSAPLLYERFCEDPVGYVENVLGDRIGLPSEYNLKSDDFLMGDEYANSVCEVKPARTECQNIGTIVKEEILEETRWQSRKQILEGEYL